MERSGKQQDRERVRHPADSPTDGARGGFAQRGVDRLDADQRHGTVAFVREVPGKHVGGQAVGASTQAGGVLPVEPADGTGRFPHVGRIHQDDEVRLEAADRPRAIFRGRPALENKEGRRLWRGIDFLARALSAEQAASDFYAGGVVAPQLLADADQDDAGGSGMIRSPVSRRRNRQPAQRLAGRKSPGCA